MVNQLIMMKLLLNGLVKKINIELAANASSLF